MLPVPATVVMRPSGATRLMRWLPVSASTMLPSASSATPCTRSSWAAVAGPPSPENPGTAVPAIVVIRPSLAWSRALSWFDGHIIDWLVNFAGSVARGFAGIDGWIDKHFVDGAVNAVATLTIEGGRTLRRVQTGRIQTYLYGALAGGLAVILLNFLIP